MPSFAYVGRDSQGTLVRGELEAEDGKQARARLRQQGLFITSLEPRTPRRHAPAGDLALVSLFTHHLSTLVTAGMPLFQSLETVAEQMEEGRMHDLLIDLARDIKEGKSLSAALSRRSNLFSQTYIGIIRHGELTGHLDHALGRLDAYLERELEFRRKVREALVYPAVVLSLAAIVLAVFLTYVIPAFERVYRSTGTALPVLTQVIIVWSKLFRNNLPALGLAAGVFILPPTRRFLWSRAAGPVQRLLLRLPRVGVLAQTVLLSRFTQTLGAMLRSGVPLSAALEVAGEAVGVAEFQPVAEALKTDVNEGRKLSDGMRQTKRFPTMIVRMVALGEEAGRLDAMLEQAGAILEREFDFQMRRLLTLLEPVATLGLGAIVGFILMALYLPIFGLSRAIAR
jgi:type IV pilus assembly protein PilC